MVDINSFYQAAQIVYTAGSLAMIYSLADLLISKRKIPKKLEGEVDISSIEKSLPHITLMIPAFKEHKVIGNTVEEMTKIRYPKDKYTALFLVDEKEDIAKKKEGEIITPLAMDIIKKGGIVYEKLFNQVKDRNPKFSKRGLITAADNYFNNAQLLVMSFLRKNFGIEYIKDKQYEQEIVSNSFSILNGSANNGEFNGQLERIIHSHDKGIFNNTFSLLENVGSFSNERLSEELWNVYNSHEIFNTTKDEVRKKIKENASKGEKGVIDLTVVPNNFNGEYPGKMLDHPVQSSKGRALNWGLHVIDKRHPQTKIIGIYDADGRPHKEVLAYIAKEAVKLPKEKDFFFQGPIYLVRNFNEVDWVCKHSGLTGTLWHKLIYPTKVLRANKEGVKRITHFSGTNYFFTRRIIEKVGGWPPFHPTEDLGVAYKVYMDFLREKIDKPLIQPHPYEEIEQTTQKFSVWFKQQYRWASGYRYQAAEVVKSDLPLKNKISLVSKLFDAPIKSTLACAAGVSGLALLTATLLGYAEAPSYAPGLSQFISGTMAVGFGMFMSCPAGIYLWSLKNKYIPYTGVKDTIKNIAQITATNIPYSILSTVPNIISWFKGLKGWGTKTPRTEERKASKEQKYLEKVLEIKYEKPKVSSSWYKEFYGHEFEKAEKNNSREMILGRKAAVDYQAFNLGIKQPDPLSKEYSDIVEKYNLHNPFYKFKLEGKDWVLAK